MMPTVVGTRCAGRESRAERDHLRFYAELAQRAGSRSCPSRHRQRVRGSRRALPTRSPSGWRRATSTTSGSTAASRPSIRRCATSVASLSAQQRRARPALAPRRRAAPDAVRHPRLHGIGVPVQRVVLLAALVLPVRLRRPVVHPAVSRPSRRKVFTVQRLRLLRARLRGFRRGDGAGRARLPVGHRLSGVHRCRPDRADRHVAGRLHRRR